VRAKSGLVCAVFLALVLYLVTLSRTWTADSLLFALDVESGDTARMVDPYHLLSHPLGWLFYQLWGWAGWSGRAIVPLQVLNALGGAACVGLVYALARHLTESARAAVLAAAGVGVSGGLWLLSVEAEFVTLPLAAHLAVLWLLLAAPARWAQRQAYALGLGLAVILAALTYLTGLLLLGVVVVGLLLRRELPRAVRRRQVPIVAAVVLVVAGAGLLLLAGWAGGGPAEWWWLFGGGRAYGQLSWTNLPHGVYAFLRSLALYPGLAMNESTRAFLTTAAARGRVLFGLYYLVVGVMALLPLLVALRCRQRLWAEHRRELGTLAVWTVLYGGFAIYWVPGDISFWVPLLVAWWLLAALVLPPVRYGEMAMSAMVSVLLVANALLAILPRHDLARNTRYALVRELAEHTAPADLVLMGGGDGLLAVYATYFARRQVAGLSLEGADLNAFTGWAGRVWRDGGRVFGAGFPPTMEPLLDSWCASVGRALGKPCSRLSAGWQMRGGAVWELRP